MKIFVKIIGIVALFTIANSVRQNPTTEAILIGIGSACFVGFALYLALKHFIK